MILIFGCSSYLWLVLIFGWFLSLVGSYFWMVLIFGWFLSLVGSYHVWLVLIFGWFLLCLVGSYLWLVPLQIWDLSRRLIGTGYWRFSDAVQFFKFGLRRDVPGGAVQKGLFRFQCTWVECMGSTFNSVEHCRSGEGMG